MEEVFLPLEQMMRLNLYQSLTEDLQTQLLQFWDANFENSMKTLLIFANKINENLLQSQRTLQHKSIKKKFKPGINNNNLLLRHVKYITMIDWKNTDGLAISSRQFEL